MTCAFESVADTHVSSRVELLEPILLCERPFVIVSRADGSAGTDSAPIRTIVLKTMDPVSVLVSASVLSRVGELQAAVGPDITKNELITLFLRVFHQEWA